MFTLILVSFSGFFRIILGLPYILVIPGYLLTVILYPKKDHLENITRVILSIGLSIIIVPVIGLIHNYLSLAVDLQPMMLTLTVFNMVLLVLSWLSRKKIPEEERFEFKVKVNITELKNKMKENKHIYSVMIITGVFIIALFIFMLSFPKNSVDFTEFYITGPDGRIVEYSGQIRTGEDIKVNVIIVNHEQETTKYRLVIRANGYLIQSVYQLKLNYLERWEKVVLFRIEKPDDVIKIEFLLYTNESVTPYRQLQLWVKAVDAYLTIVHQVITEEGETY